MRRWLLGVCAVVALTVLVGVTSASATELYSGQFFPSTVNSGTKVSLSLQGETTTPISDTTENPITTCTGSSINGQVSSAGSSSTTVVIPVESVSLTGGCKVTIKLPGSLEVHHIAGTTSGTLTGNGFGFSVHTEFGIECTYGPGESGTDLGVLEGSTNNTFTTWINAILNELAPKKFLCPDTARWLATFKGTTPDPLFVEAS